MLSLGIISYGVTEDLTDTTKLAINSYRPQVDELIVVENAGHIPYEADVMISFQENQYFTRAANAILRIAREDYIAVVNNDTYLISGDLEDLCIPDTITSPNPPHEAEDGIRGWFFVIPKSILPILGYLDEKYVHFNSDVDMVNRIKELGIAWKTVSSVIVNHFEDLTRKTVPSIIVP